MLKKLIMRASSRYPFGADDFFQQVIGSALLASPFIFTEELWTIAAGTSTVQTLLTVGVTLVLGHGILYVAEQERDWTLERKFYGILTLRYLSLMGVSFGTVLLILLLTGTPSAFNATVLQTFKAISIISIFSVIGAATADSLI